MLKRCMEVNDCSNFMRPNATLIAIFVSDEEDHSLNSINSYVNSFNSLKPNAFIPYGIIGDVPAGCSKYPLIASAGFGYWELINHYGSQWWSICEEDWGNQLQEIAHDISLMLTFPLDDPDPFVDSITVKVNGQVIGTGWSYDPNLNAVVFDYANAPEQGDSIDISYSSWSCN